jgi:molecular chaperone GrpE (heat shock protein)
MVNMENKSQISNAILEELTRYNKINNYITEQEALVGDLPPAPDEAAPADATVPPADTTTPPPPAEATPEPIDVNADPEVEKIGSEEESTEELDITDLVTSQKNVETKQEEYFNNLFTQISNLESKLSEMDNLVQKLNDIEAKIEKYRQKTPQEKLELRSLDSGPFNQKLTDFFDDKEQDIEKSGKNEYVLTTDEIQDFTPTEIKNTFNDYSKDGDYLPVKS